MPPDKAVTLHRFSQLKPDDKHHKLDRSRPRSSLDPTVLVKSILQGRILRELLYSNSTKEPTIINIYWNWKYI